jgi:hypothetical protein
MSAVVEQLVFEDVWHGLYGESWKGLICDEAFAHPAKFSRALIRRIYDHVIEEGWASKGDSVVDPFGGVALGAHDAMRHGLNWYGCELEAKFVSLGTHNIALWNERFSRMPNWGTAKLLQGDSRKLVEVLSTSTCAVSSPPYVLARQDTTHPPPKLAAHFGEAEEARIHALSVHTYGSSEGQLGAMKEGDLNFAISSPPYVEGLGHGGRPTRGAARSDDRNLDAMQNGYGASAGQLGAMPEGQLSISSPPFPQPYKGGGGINVHGYKGAGMTENEDHNIGKRHYQSQGGDRTDGNLETLDAGGFECAVSSPPFEGSDQRKGGSDLMRTQRIQNGRNPDAPGTAGMLTQTPYGDDKNNLGNQSGETFWSASRLILEQLHQVIVPGGHAVFVVKAFVRDKKIVDFPGQWAQLCEAVGFRLLHHHRASLVEHSGTQGGFDEDKEIRVERKSFFRRLAESKGSPRIDHESVLCFERA